MHDTVIVQEGHVWQRMTTISKHCENATCNSRKLNRIRRDTPKMWITRQPSTTLPENPMVGGPDEAQWKVPCSWARPVEKGLS